MWGRSLIKPLNLYGNPCVLNIPLCTHDILPHSSWYPPVYSCMLPVYCKPPGVLHIHYGGRVYEKSFNQSTVRLFLKTTYQSLGMIIKIVRMSLHCVKMPQFILVILFLYKSPFLFFPDVILSLGILNNILLHLYIWIVSYIFGEKKKQQKKTSCAAQRFG